MVLVKKTYFINLNSSVFLFFSLSLNNTKCPTRRNRKNKKECFVEYLEPTAQCQ